MTLRSFAQHTPHLGADVYIDETALVIGQVSIAQDSSVWPIAVVRGDVHAITIGARTNIQDHCMLHVTHAGRYQPQGFGLSIGDDVTIGHQVVLHGCTIGDGCLIGMGSLILDGAIIEPGAMLGAGSIVPPGKVITSGNLWLGRPSRRIRALCEEEKEFLLYSATHYVRLQQQHRAQE